MSKYKVNSIVTCTVTGIKKYGIFVNLDNYYSGLIHISEISNKFVKDASKIVKIGDIINAKILSIDEETFHIKLSIKNINYKKNEYRYKKIKEIGSGFDILKNNLENWIKIAKNENKN